ncbi:hypothetical protein GCM10007175_30970 [Pseudarthrobacter scleromae]|uniref:Uncharacterized protein n=1 Tax=Pseudarthrobacter scleromae TaxID=158897 RepID=A0ABQ2CLD2_9MICC|nr:hypothetical protein GCM10007175_30970 [Pseudarthrobacter scleromae]
MLCDAAAHAGVCKLQQDGPSRSREQDDLRVQVRKFPHHSLRVPEGPDGSPGPLQQPAAMDKFTLQSSSLYTGGIDYRQELGA